MCSGHQLGEDALKVAIDAEETVEVECHSCIEAEVWFGELSWFEAGVCRVAEEVAVFDEDGECCIGDSQIFQG